MTLDNSLLGKTTEYPQTYCPEILQPIPRNISRKKLGLSEGLFFSGKDIWTAFEVSWLDPQGKPEVRIAEIAIACNSVNLVESKSLKLYFNSFNNERYPNQQSVADLVLKDIENCVQGKVDITFWTLDEYPNITGRFEGICLDELQVSCNDARPNPSRLICDPSHQVTEQIYSHLLKTNCPVTGQPDWASVWINYQGPKMDHAGLLQYLVSYRQHQDFHENCVEAMLTDIAARCQPTSLAIYARYTRRGGLDINPFRFYGETSKIPKIRVPRQ